MPNFNKHHFCFLLALTIFVGVFVFPVVAFAEGGTIVSEETISVYESYEDAQPGYIYGGADYYPGFEAIYYETDDLLPGYVTPRTGLLTPDGTGTVVDNVFIEGNGLEFFTFTTERGNIFYLVIDRMSDFNNVFFLNAVTEEDLLALADIETETREGFTISGVPPIPVAEYPPEYEQAETPQEPPADNGGINGTLIFLLMGVIVAVIVGYYVKIILPKKRAVKEDEFDDYDEAEENDSDY